MALHFETCACPYCGEPATIAVDASAGNYACIEDCPVCCRPIALSIVFDAQGIPRVTARREDE